MSRRHPGVRVPACEVFGRTASYDDLPPGVPYLVPQVQLLYKAKYHRPKDDADFDAAVGLMTGSQRRWLRDTLRVHHPGDAWIERL